MIDAQRVDFIAVPVSDPSGTGVCHMVFLSDPDGNALLLHHRYEPYSDGSQP